MRHAPVTPNGDAIRWVELPGDGPARVCLHGLGASSPVYYAAAAAHPLLAGRRTLLLDMLGFGISDRPADFPYTLEAQADAIAIALEAAGVAGAEVVGHSMGGAVAIVLAARHPHLVARLVVVDANLDPYTPSAAPGHHGLATLTEEEFVGGERRAEVRDRVGPFWWATMRLAGPEALHRSAVHLARGTEPTMRELLHDLPVPRTLLYPAEDGAYPGADGLRAAGVAVVPVPDCGHNVMVDNTDGYARALVAAGAERS